MNNYEKLMNATLEDLKRGYSEESGFYECLLCGKKTENGIIYPEKGLFFEAEKYMQVHINEVHGSVFEFLLNLDKRTTGLSDHQNTLLRLFYEGRSDSEIQKEIGVGSSSTVRNHRFALKERERQARVFLTLMELLKTSKKPQKPEVRIKGQSLVEEWFSVTEEERKQILEKYFPQGVDGPLSVFPAKEKHKAVVVEQLATRFQAGKTYAEKEVNAILSEAWNDFATIRRYLINYRFMERKADGSSYWLKTEMAESKAIPANIAAEGEKREDTMERRKELMDQYKQIKKEAGVYQIRNTENNRIFVAATPNLKSLNGKRFELNLGNFRSDELQADWNRLGEGAFVFEVLEVLKEKEEGFFDTKDELKKLEKKWLDKLQPYGDKGYNVKKHE